MHSQWLCFGKAWSHKPHQPYSSQWHTQGVGPEHAQVKNLTFRADFDSGNLASAKEGSLPNVRSSLPHCSGESLR